MIYGSCPKTLTLCVRVARRFFFGPDLQLRKMRWSGAEGYAKGDVISNYHIQRPHIHLCTCWYKWHFVVTIGCTFVTVSTSPQPSTCSNVFRLSGFGTEGSYYMTFSSWWYFLLLISRKSYPISQHKKDSFGCWNNPLIADWGRGKKNDQRSLRLTLCRSPKERTKTLSLQWRRNLSKCRLWWPAHAIVLLPWACCCSTSLRSKTFPWSLGIPNLKKQMETLELQNCLELFRSF